MDVLLRGVSVYLLLLLVFRISGARTFADITPFDFVLLLIVAEAVQQALLGEDFSVTTAALLTVTLVGIDIAMSLTKQRVPWLEHFTESVPIVLVERGEPLIDRMKKARVNEEDVLSAARLSQGLRSMDEIEYAVLEKSGGISVIPKRG